MEIKGKLVFSIRASLLRQIVILAEVIANEGLLHFEQDGIHFQLVDPSHVAMIVAHVKKEAMAKYAPGDDLVLDLDSVKSLLANAEDEETVELYVKKEKPPAPVFRIGNMTRTMTYLDPKGQAQPKLPDLTHDAVIGLDLNSIRRGLKNMEAFTDFMSIEYDGAKSVTLRGERDNDVIEITPEAKVIKDPKKRTRAIYALDYFMGMIKHLGKDVTISYSTDYPMILDAKLEDTEGSIVELGTIKYLLAPKIEDV
jgi:DNA polymerase III sliding clamp (beta) subunit (PCNA family)